MEQEPDDRYQQRSLFQSPRFKMILAVWIVVIIIMIPVMIKLGAPEAPDVIITINGYETAENFTVRFEDGRNLTFRPENDSINRVFFIVNFTAKTTEGDGERNVGSYVFDLKTTGGIVSHDFNIHMHGHMRVTEPQITHLNQMLEADQTYTGLLFFSMSADDSPLALLHFSNSIKI